MLKPAVVGLAASAPRRRPTPIGDQRAEHIARRGEHSVPERPADAGRVTVGRGDQRMERGDDRSGSAVERRGAGGFPQCGEAARMIDGEIEIELEVPPRVQAGWRRRCATGGRRTARTRAPLVRSTTMTARRQSGSNGSPQGVTSSATERPVDRSVAASPDPDGCNLRDGGSKPSAAKSGARSNLEQRSRRRRRTERGAARAPRDQVATNAFERRGIARSPTGGARRTLRTTDDRRHRPAWLRHHDEEEPRGPQHHRGGLLERGESSCGDAIAVRDGAGVRSGAGVRRGDRTVPAETQPTAVDDARLAAIARSRARRVAGTIERWRRRRRASRACRLRSARARPASIARRIGVDPRAREPSRRRRSSTGSRSPIRRDSATRPLASSYATRHSSSTRRPSRRRSDVRRAISDPRAVRLELRERVLVFVTGAATARPPAGRLHSRLPLEALTITIVIVRISRDRQSGVDLFFVRAERIGRADVRCSRAQGAS